MHPIISLITFIGTVRKSLSINFVGETREANQIYIVDATLEGLEGGNVRYHHSQG